MRISILAALILVAVVRISEPVKLTLLDLNKNFKPAIIDTALKLSQNPTDIVMLHIAKKNQLNATETYQLSLSTLESKEFAYFDPIKYYGYFEYKNHFILVYGDNSPVHFFIKTTLKKQFAFLPTKTRDPNEPPISIENDSIVYTFTKGQYSKPEWAMGAYLNN